VDGSDALRDILWKMYEENITKGRHHETERATVTNLVIAVAAAVLALVTYDKAITLIDLPLTIFLIFLGVFGAAFSSKYYERYQLHMKRARVYRNALDKVLSSQAGNSKRFLKELKKAADEEHEKSFQPTSKGKTNWQRWMTFIHRRGLYQLWITFHLLITLLGLVLSILSFFHIQGAA
jgi:ABC-type multidrug transport system fused ATPase/permease subunit